MRAEATCFHHLLVAHGRAARSSVPRAATATSGSRFRLHRITRSRGSPADAEAAWASDGYVNRSFLDPVLKGTYPDDVHTLYERILGRLDFVCDGDLETIASLSDFLGVNYYSRRVIPGTSSAAAPT